MLGGFLHICTCTYTIYCGLWPPGNTTCLFLTFSMCSRWRVFWDWCYESILEIWYIRTSEASPVFVGIACSTFFSLVTHSLLKPYNSTENFLHLTHGFMQCSSIGIALSLYLDVCLQIVSLQGSSCFTCSQCSILSCIFTYILLLQLACWYFS
jgi:hypothetical protein